MRTSFLKPTTLLLTSLLLGGCGEGLLLNHSDRQVHQAPQSADDIGVVVTNAGEQDVAALMDENPQARFRTINSKHGLYEIHGVSEGSINKALPHLNTMTNEFITMDMTKSQPTLNSSNLEEFVLMNTSTSNSEKLNPCVQASKAPDASLIVDGKELKGEKKNRGAGSHFKF